MGETDTPWLPNHVGPIQASLGVQGLALISTLQAAPICPWIFLSAERLCLALPEARTTTIPEVHTRYIGMANGASVGVGGPKLPCAPQVHMLGSGVGTAIQVTKQGTSRS